MGFPLSKSWLLSHNNKIWDVCNNQSKMVNQPPTFRHRNFLAANGLFSEYFLNHWTSDSLNAEGSSIFVNNWWIRGWNNQGFPNGFPHFNGFALILVDLSFQFQLCLSNKLPTEHCLRSHWKIKGQIDIANGLSLLMSGLPPQVQSTYEYLRTIW